MNLHVAEFLPEIRTALFETFQMLTIGLVFAVVFGGLIGVGLFVWKKQGLLENRFLSISIGTLVNIVRSFPFVILLISIGPLTRFLTGTTIGPIAASVPLAISAIAYFARIVELALSGVPRGITEAALAMGASNGRIIWSFLLVEAKSSLILGFTALTVSFISYTAAAGIVGGGGLGDLAIRYGYYRFQSDIMFVTVLILVVLVQIIQVVGNKIASHHNRK